MTSAQKSKVIEGLPRLWRFLRKPLHEKSQSFLVRWKRLFPDIPVPVRLPFGAWFLARNDGLGAMLTYDGHEKSERSFVERFLLPGMTVLDIGAHHGLYTLLASRRVGRQGRVFSFEPSPRERKALLLNLMLNQCRNVTVQEFALGSEENEADFYLVEDFETGCNSLRPPALDSGSYRSIRVPVLRLDDWLRRWKIDTVDFIKLDVEGAELSVLNGATDLLTQNRRPIILAEVEDRRTSSWGYHAHEILLALDAVGYNWFELGNDQPLVPLGPARDRFQANLVAVPREDVKEVLSRLG